MADEKTNIISFAEEHLKRTGVQLDLAKVAAGHAASTRRVKVNPDEDFVIGMAMDILSIVTGHADTNPIGVIAALQVVGSTLGAEYTRKLGHAKVKELITAAAAISTQYQPEFKYGTDAGTTASSDTSLSQEVAGDQEDESER